MIPESMDKGLFGILERASELAPDSRALVSPRMTFTFKELLNSSLILARFLRQLGLNQGDRFWVDLPPEISLIMNFAAAHEGLVMVPFTTSYQSPEKLDCKRLVSQSIGEGVYPIKPDVLSQELLAKLAADQEYLDFRGDATGNEVFRALFTSGTTGNPKPAVLTSQQLVRRASNLRQIAGIGPRHLTMLSSEISLGFTTMLSNLLRLETFFQTSSSAEAGVLINNFQIESLLTSPAQLSDLLTNSLGAAALSQLSRIQLTGAAPSSTVVQRLREVFGGQLEVQFGSTETGAFALQKINGKVTKSLGQIYPWAKIQAVDDNGVEVQTGQIGHLRIQTLDMVQNYLDQSSPAIDQGWFYGGDLCLVGESGEIFLSGRATERLNVGGMKVSPEELEVRIRELLDFTDFAVFSAQGKDGSPMVGLAFVAEEKPDINFLQSTLQLHLGARAPIAAFRVPAIPRNELGKVARQELARAFLASLQ